MDFQQIEVLGIRSGTMCVYSSLLFGKVECTLHHSIESMFDLDFQTGQTFFRIKLNFRNLKLYLRFQINSNRFSKDRSLWHQTMESIYFIHNIIYVQHKQKVIYEIKFRNVPKKFFNQNRMINTLHSETKWIIPFGYHFSQKSKLLSLHLPCSHLGNCRSNKIQRDVQDCT